MESLVFKFYIPLMIKNEIKNISQGGVLDIRNVDKGADKSDKYSDLHLLESEVLRWNSTVLDANNARY